MVIRIGIYGYGNLGRGTELAISQNPDMSLAGIFTRRNPADLTPASAAAKVYPAQAAIDMSDEIDVMVLCGGSATDLPEQTPMLARYFNVVDSFDTHAEIPRHFGRVDEAARGSRHCALISAGWDPGMFSLSRLYSGAILPEGKDYTFWGKGVSQGHSDAIRRIDGVLDARQYTIPVENALEAVRKGETPELSTREKHTRDCYVAVKEGADMERIRHEIVSMPNYFADYDTTVTFVSAHELETEHKAIPHGGFVFRSGITGGGNRHLIEYSLKLDSNPEFTSSVLLACARAVFRLHGEGKSGCFTLLDVPPSYLSRESADVLRAKLL